MWSRTFFSLTSRKTLALVTASLWLTLAAAPVAASPGHALWAEDVARNVSPEHNAYGNNPTYLTWPGVQGAIIYANRTKCSPFVTRVFKQTYGWSDSDFQRWFGSSSPSAAMYHDAIREANHFLEIQHIDDIQRGDIIAVKYPAGSASTGHVMIAASPAMPRRSTAPVVADTTQYDIEVIDSSRSGHGPTDTRRRKDGLWDTGAGIGVFRLYADDTGTLVGYTWSTYNDSVYHDQTVRPLVVGRLLVLKRSSGWNSSGLYE